MSWNRGRNPSRADLGRPPDSLVRQAYTVFRVNESSGDRDQESAALRPTEPQRRYLERGLSQPGGKLPLFDSNGREVAPRTVQACVAHGWAEPWFNNPIKPDWQVCRLTAKGYAALGQAPPDSIAKDGTRERSRKKYSKNLP